MSREAVATALDEAAEALARAAHALRGMEPAARESAAAGPGSEGANVVPPPRSSAPAPTSKFSQCPAHHRDWKPSKFENGPGYCTAPADDPAWSKNGYCSIDQRSASKWAEIHNAPSDVPF